MLSGIRFVRRVGLAIFTGMSALTLHAQTIAQWPMRRALPEILTSAPRGLQPHSPPHPRSVMSIAQPLRTEITLKQV